MKASVTQRICDIQRRAVDYLMLGNDAKAIIITPLHGLSLGLARLGLHDTVISSNNFGCLYGRGSFTLLQPKVAHYYEVAFEGVRPTGRPAVTLACNA